MNKIKLSGIALAFTLSLSALPGYTQVTVGGAAMYPTKDIIDNAVNSKDHTTLVAAVSNGQAGSDRKLATPRSVLSSPA